MQIHRGIVALFIVGALGCSPTEELVDRGPAGGKADGVSGCPEGVTCLDFDSYEVLFTNPICDTYEYDEPVETVSGDFVDAKPQNVYCTSDDKAVSGDRESSPRFRISQWIDELGDGDEIFLAYLSFSDPQVADKLCEAVDRGVEVTFVLDKMTSKAEQLRDCGGRVLIRGHQGSVGFAHNKLILVNPKKTGPGDEFPDFMRLSFGSGNMSSGTVVHHENWHFIEVARDSFFVESHLCLMEALIDPAHTDGKGAFRSFINECRSEIEFEEENDIWAFFIPNLEDSRFVTGVMLEGLETAGSVDIAAHRFSHSAMVNTLEEHLADDFEFKVRLVADDDLYWLNPLRGRGEQVGPNDFNEARKVELLSEAGDEGQFEVKYMETNHGRHLLHHNKFMIFKDMPDFPDAVLCGAANYTGTGFESNLENIYYIDIPHVVEAYKEQYGLFWGDGASTVNGVTAPRATAPEDMPVANISVQ